MWPITYWHYRYGPSLSCPVQFCQYCNSGSYTVIFMFTFLRIGLLSGRGSPITLPRLEFQLLFTTCTTPLCLSFLIYKWILKTVTAS